MLRELNLKGLPSDGNHGDGNGALRPAFAVVYINPPVNPRKKLRSRCQSEQWSTVAYHGRGSTGVLAYEPPAGTGSATALRGRAADPQRRFRRDPDSDRGPRRRRRRAPAGDPCVRARGRGRGNRGLLDMLRREGVEFCRERLVLDPEARSRPGVLTGVRVVDSVLTLGGSVGDGELLSRNPAGHAADPRSASAAIW